MHLPIKISPKTSKLNENWTSYDTNDKNFSKFSSSGLWLVPRRPYIFWQFTRIQSKSLSITSELLKLNSKMFPISSNQFQVAPNQFQVASNHFWTTYINIFVIFYNYCRFLNMISGLWKNRSRLIKTGLWTTHRPIKTGLYQPSPVIGIFGPVLDRSQSRLSPIWVQNPDQTGLWNTTIAATLPYATPPEASLSVPILAYFSCPPCWHPFLHVLGSPTWVSECPSLAFFIFYSSSDQSWTPPC